MLDLLYTATAIEPSKIGLHRLPVGDHVGHAGRYPQVVLEDVKSLVRAHQIGSTDGDIRAVGDANAPHFHAILGTTTTHHVDGNDPVFDDASRSVDVGQEKVQGLQALRKSGFEPTPFSGGDKPGQTVDRHNAFIGLIAAVDRKRDTFAGKGMGDPFLHANEFFNRKPEQGIVERTAVITGRAVGLEHLVVEIAVEFVIFEVHNEGLRSSDQRDPCPGTAGYFGLKGALHTLLMH